MNQMSIKTYDELHLIFDSIFKKYKIKKIWLFGSYAKNTQTVYSDVDFLYLSADSLLEDVYILLDFSEEMFAQSAKYFMKECDLVEYETICNSKYEKHISMMNNSILFYEEGSEI